jgi:hypothetical protein
MRVGEVGITLTVLPNPVGVFDVNILNSTSSLIINSPSTINYKKIVSLVVAPDGWSASYVTQAGDFPVEGVYLCQLMSTFINGQVLMGSIAQLEVDTSLQQ